MIKQCVSGLAALLLIGSSGGALGANFLVCPDGSGDYETIQLAVDAAADGDVIELANGVFAGRGNKDINYLGKAVTIRSQSGNPDSCIIDVEGEFNQTAQRGFVFLSGEGGESLLRDLTIINGVADGPCPACEGAGVYSEHSSPTIINVKFIGNYALSGAGFTAVGGSPTISGCAFVGNQGLEGAGIMIYDSSAAVIDHCIFYNNLASNQGGAIYAHTESSPIVTNCTIVGNWSAMGGGIRLWESDLTLENSIIAFSDQGEAINIYGESQIEILYSDLYGNQAGDWTEPFEDQAEINGNLTVDPQFVDTSAADYRLQDGSPCIDAGNPNSPHDPDGTIADMGAYFYDQTVGISGPGHLPVAGFAAKNFPNPFNASTEIRFNLPQQMTVQIEFFDLLGRRLESITLPDLPAGTQAYTWNAATHPSGLYFYRLQAADYSLVNSCVLLK